VLEIRKRKKIKKKTKKKKTKKKVRYFKNEVRLALVRKRLMRRASTYIFHDVKVD